jgi:carboxyl-terminal processing protease
VTLTRAAVKYPSVTSKMLQDGVGLVQVPALVEGRVREVAQQADSLQKQGAKKLILDLRNSGFGTPADGVALANLFLDKGTITYLQGQKTKRQDFTADAAKATLKNIPLVLMTNRGTANAAEIAAAALLDNKRAEVVGERTYGDAAVRRAVTMDDGSAVLLAVAKYYSPSGKAIQDNGVSPTYMVTDSPEPNPDTDDEDVAPGPPEVRKDSEDNVLKKAIEVSTTGKTQAGATAGTTAPPDSPQALPEKRNPLLPGEVK